MRHLTFVFLSFLFLVHSVWAQHTTMPLWPEKIPNQLVSSEKEIKETGDILFIRNVQIPTLTVYLPSKKNATGQALIVCPGGGYYGLAYDWEGSDIAKWLNSKGIAAFVLKYRLPGSPSLIVREKAPLQDAQRAIRMVRYHAKPWNIKANQVGVIGFSAGGHLAATLSTRYDDNSYPFLSNPIDNLSARPDFTALIYPVITMKPPYVHKGSRENLLGKNPKAEQIDHYSAELHVNQNTPPAFLVHSADDTGVPVMNSLLFYESLVNHSIPSEMHIYPNGGHGYALSTGHENFKTWTDRLSDWLISLKPKDD